MAVMRGWKRVLSRDTSLLYSTIEWSDFERKNGHLASCAELFFEMLLPLGAAKIFFEYLFEN